VKIAIIIPNDFSAVWFCEILIKKLLLNHNITVISDIHDDYKYGFYLDIIKKWGVKHEFVKFYRFISPLNDIKYIHSLYEILKRDNYDMVINISTKPNIYGSIAAKIAGVNIIMSSVWGLGLMFSGEKNIKSIALKAIATFLYRVAFMVNHHIWFTNKNDYDYFFSRKIIDEKKTILTKNYVNTKQYAPRIVSNQKTSSLKNSLGYSESDQVVIMLSRLSWAKGVREFCEASDLLRDTYPSLKFLLVGHEDIGSSDCVPRGYIEKYQAYENFNWIGFRQDVKELYSISYLAVYPSYYREGGYPRGLTEPMAMGKPVIGTDSIHCSAAVENGVSGLLVPIKDPSALAKAIEKIVTNEEFANNLGNNARKKMINEFDESMIIEKLIDKVV
jgi:N,N'-diacetylbacillosaminyl-diphospho-undecaprenol alpha-1,3-N-acetylgalactosaminyltransferase